MADVFGVLTRGRAAARSLFTDACTISRASGSVMDPVTFVETPQKTTIYTGPCRLKVTEVGTTEASGRVYVITAGVLQLPVGDVVFEDDDEVTMTSVVFDPTLVGTILSIRGRPLQSHATMWRLPVSEVVNT